MSKGRKGFTLIEALVAVVLAGVGVVSAVRGLSSLTTAQARLSNKETMYRLAEDKFEEISGQIQPVSESGDFSEQGLTGFQWESEVATTGVENVSLLTVTISSTDESASSQTEVVEGLVYRTPQATGGTQ